ncbi:MAG: hypothetical protein QMC62_14300 [Alteromonadaceae bacterium]
MENNKFKVNKIELVEAKKKVKASYTSGYSKECEKPNKGSVQQYYSGFKEAITGSIEYHNKGYSIDLRQSHNNYGFYLVFTKPQEVQDAELQALYNAVEAQFRINLESDKRLFVEQQLSFENDAKQVKLNAIKEKEVEKKQKTREKLILQKMAAL